MRLLKELTLKAPAQLAGCSESLLSQIENGIPNPSIRTVHRVALALNMRISGLFQGGHDDDNVMLRQGERPTVQVGQGKGHKLEALIRIEEAIYSLAMPTISSQVAPVKVSQPTG